MNRIEGINIDYPNLVRIPTAICINSYSIYMLDNNKISHPINLTNLNLGIKIGNTPLEKVLGKYSPYKTTTYEQLITMLLNKRLDVIAMNKVAYKNAIRNKKHSQSKAHIIAVDYPFPVLYGYHYLHKKHVNLISLISDKLVSFESEGYIKKANEEHKNFIIKGK
jgi:hypothetical protein